MHPSIDEGPRSAPLDPSAGPAPVVVLLHGQPGTASDWYRVVPLLSPDHRVIAVDRPGYCGEPSEARDWAGNADALLAMLDELGLEQVILVAASWSGGVAVEAARKARERISGIVFVAAVGGKGAITWLDRVIAWGPIRGVGARLAPHTGVSLARPFWWALGSRLDEEANREARLSLAVWRSRRVWTAAAIEQRYLVRDHEQLIAHVAELDVPAIVLQGTHDYTIPLQAGVRLAQALPHAELIKPDAGHMLAFEEPVVVAEAVRRLTGRPHERAHPRTA
jgi:pimeloyl-ACP methyl ester carboxylesterase